MRAVALNPIAVPFCDDAVKVTALRWNADEATVIEVISKRSGRRCRIEFRDDVGLRILGELDLASMWMGQPRAALKSTWLFQVGAGGWFDLESTRDDFHLKHEPPAGEFLIAGYQECVSVLSRREPVVTELSKESDA